MNFWKILHFGEAPAEPQETSPAKAEFTPVCRKVKVKAYNFTTPLSKIDFVALDVETATSKGGVCQLGLVEIKAGQIVKERSYLISPPRNEYEIKNIRIHGITPEATASCFHLPAFWEEIKDIIDNKVIVGHNISFDINALDKDCYTYGLEPLDYSRDECTCALHNRAKLVDVCDHYGIDLGVHHDALSDARASALCYLKYLASGAKDPQVEKKDRSAKMFDNLAISHDTLVQDLESCTRTDTIFYDKKVVITGIFQNYPKREDLAALLKSYGADINTSISKKTDIVVVGAAAGPSKLNKIADLNSSGCNIRIVNEDELYTLI